MEGSEHYQPGVEVRGGRFEIIKIFGLGEFVEERIQQDPANVVLMLSAVGKSTGPLTPEIRNFHLRKSPPQQFTNCTSRVCRS